MTGTEGDLHCEVGGTAYRFVDLATALGGDPGRLPVVLRLLAENVARTQTGAVREAALAGLAAWADEGRSDVEIPVVPGRLLMHDTTSTPALVDIAAMRDALAERGGDPSTLGPVLPVEVSVDHSLAVDAYGRSDALELNMRSEIRRNRERYEFLKWASGAMERLHVNPPGTGIMHTINLEQLATVVTTEERDGERWTVPDLMVGTDSHTPMVSGLGVLAWGIGGLEAETVMLGMPITLRIPEVVGVRLTGRLRPGVLATDLALTVTSLLRGMGVTGELVEFCGPGVSTLTVGDRAVVANMAPEYGATTGYFPVDDQTLAYLRETGREEEQIELVESYCRATGLWFDPEAKPRFTRITELDLDTVQTSVAGPRRPQDLRALAEAPSALREASPEARATGGMPAYPVALAAITSCTNTSDPRLLVIAGLLAGRARRLGLSVPEWVKTSLAPGSPAAASYLQRAGLGEDLRALGFDIVGFGCTTCIGNSGELPEAVRDADGIRPVAILSGNRNFPGRVHPDLDLGYLMSPPLVVGYALAGDAAVDIAEGVVAAAPDGREVRLADLWPSEDEIAEAMALSAEPQDFPRDFAAASRNRLWDALPVPDGERFPWDPDSTTLRRPPFADADQGSLLGDYAAYPLLVLGDDVTTDHISPASAIPADSYVADFLAERGEDRGDLNVYAARRGNWEVMARGAFHNRSLVNSLVPQGSTGLTVHAPSGDVAPIWEVARRYAAERESVVVVAGERYGMGSSRDWAAKAQRLLGVRAVLAAGFERIHRTNLVGMGILPVVVPEEVRPRLAALVAGDRVEVSAQPDAIAPGAEVPVRVVPAAGDAWGFTVRAAVETSLEVELLRTGGVIPMIMGRSAPGPLA
ncbi:aconitate hydratase AcnA [Actinomycetota bacterium]